MSNKKEFYSNEDIPTSFQKVRMWKSVKNSVYKTCRNNFYFDVRNFSLGFGFAVILLFAAIGLNSVISNKFEAGKPEIVKLNEAYFNAIKYLEKNSSLNNASLQTTVNLDEVISERNEQLKVINQAIDEFKLFNSGKNYSHLEQTKLNDLYKMKLEVISKLIKFKEQQL